MKKIVLIIVSILLFGVMGACGVGKSAGKADVLKQYKEAAVNAKYIMHSLGGMENTYTYTNSIDALRTCYEEGYRFFEVDISLTSDGKPVCAHAATVDGEENVWRKVEWEKRLGQKYDPDHTLASYDEFMSFTIQGKFKATDFADIVEFMSEHKDMYIMLDVNNRSYEGTKKIYEAIVAEAKGNTDVLNRFIAGGHTTQMMDAVADVYDFPLLNLYFANQETRQDSLKKPGDFVAYCRENGITSFSTSCATFKAEDISLLSDNLIGYVFTTDDPAEAAAIHKEGFVAGTNFLRDE